MPDQGGESRGNWHRPVELSPLKNPRTFRSRSVNITYQTTKFMPTSTLITDTLVRFFVNIYMILLVIRCLLTWFPNVPFFNRVASVLSPITDPYLDLFRSFIPPLGGMMDISPMIAILALQIALQLVSSVLSPSGPINLG